MKKIKVLWIITTGLRKNGICLSQLGYLKNINKDKFDIHVVAFENDNKDIIDLYKKNSKIIILPNRKKKLFLYCKLLKKKMIDNKYDVIHVFGSSTLMLIELQIAKKCKIKTRIAHSRNTTCDRPWLDKILRFSFNRSYNVALACGKEAGEWLFPNKKFIVIHNGKDLDSFKFNVSKRIKKRKELNLTQEIAIGHVGFFNKQKNHVFLIDIFNEIYKHNKNVRLFLMGYGFKMPEIKKKVKDLGLSHVVSFLGNVDNVSEYLQAMDLMLFPSLFEGLPNVVIEWQASGLPSIISDKITKECKVSDLVCFLPINQDSEMWYKTISKIEIYNDDIRRKKSKEACLLLEKNGFSIESSTLQLEKIYSQDYK